MSNYSIRKIFNKKRYSHNFVKRFCDCTVLINSNKSAKLNYALRIKHYALNSGVFLFKIFLRFGLLEIFRI